MSHISRRTGIIGFFTLLSRILGLLRDSVLAYAFGATAMADAFYVAFRIPNLLRRLVAEGSLTVAFVPIYTEWLRKSRESGREAASVVFSVLTLFLTLLVIFGILFAPWIVQLIARGFSDDPQTFTLTVYLTRLMFPYIFFISLVALAMGVLNSLKRFVATSASPIVLNVGIIFGALLLRHFFDLPVVGVAVGVLLGGVLQLAMQIPSLRKEGMLPRFDVRLRHPALKGLLLLMIPSAIGAAVYQINVLVITRFASYLPEGSVSYLWYADRVAEFPLGVFGLALATAILPTLSDHAVDQDREAFVETMNYGLRLTFLITIPASVGLYILAEPIVALLFERGVFDVTATKATAAALLFFAIKIPFLSAVRNIAGGFFALKDAKTPVVVSVFAVAVNALAALWLMKTFAHVGLAAALAISSAFNFFLLLYLFRRKMGLIGGRKLLSSLGKTLLASFIMGSVLLLGEKFFGTPYGISLILFILVGMGVFFVAAKLIHPEEFSALMAIIRRKQKMHV